MLFPARPRLTVRYCGVAAAIVALVLIPAGIAHDAHEQITSARLIATPSMPLPALGTRYMDPIFDTAVRRVTEPGRALAPRIVCARDACRHRYSSTQAWNADQSLLLIDKGCADICFLDGRTFQPLFVRRVSADQDCKWHPVRAEQMICVHSGGVASWTPRSNAWQSVFDAGPYSNLAFGPYKGNPSLDGRWIVLRALDPRSEPVAFALDLDIGRKEADIPLRPLTGDNHYATISPSGRFVYVTQLTSDGQEPAYVFTRDGQLVQHWPEHHRPGHGDMTLDADGRDVYVGISKSAPDKYHVIKRRLEDGAVTVLAAYGNASHVSARNIRQPGWVYVTYQGSHGHTLAMGYPSPFYGEIVALSIDGGGMFRRIAHTHAVDHDYIAESHASPSPDGSQVIFASNWGQAGWPVSSFVADTTPSLAAGRPD